MADILGPDGKPVRAESLRVPERALGASGIELDYVSEGLTPGSLAQLMKDADEGDIQSQAMLYDQMTHKDGHLQGEYGKRRRAILDVEWSLEPADSTAEAKKALELVKEHMAAWRTRGVYEALQYRIGHGFSVVEMLWSMMEGQARIAGFKYQKQARFKFQGEENTILAYMKGKRDPVKMKPFKAIVATYGGLSGDPKVGEVFRACAWYYLFKNYTLKDWLVFAEVYGMPLRVGTFPPGAGDEEKQALKTALYMMGSDGAGIIPEGTKIDFISHKGTSGADIYERLAAYCERGMSKVLVGQTLTAEAGDKGSYSLGKVHREVELDLVASDAWEVAEIMEDQVFRPLVGFNFGWEYPVPRLRPKVKGREDEKTRLDVVKGAVEMGVPVGRKWFYEEFRIPEPAEDEELVNGAGGEPKDLKNVRRVALGGSGFTADQQLLEDVVEELSGELGVTRDVVLDLILKTVAAAQDYEDLQDRLLDLVEERSPEFEEMLGRALYAADLWGRVNA